MLSRSLISIRTTAVVAIIAIIVIIVALAFTATTLDAAPVPAVHGCFACGTPSTGAVCCAGGQNCPGGVPCCGKGAGWSCNTSCAPQCQQGQTCGDGGCGKSPWNCGRCGKGQGCGNNYACADCCRKGFRECGHSKMPGCESTNCGTCNATDGCVDGFCEPCCPAYQKCGASRACPGKSCGSCASGQGCVDGACVACCPAYAQCGASPNNCHHVSCGACKSGYGCLDNQCDRCDGPAKDPYDCGVSPACPKQFLGNCTAKGTQCVNNRCTQCCPAASPGKVPCGASVRCAGPSVSCGAVKCGDGASATCDLSTNLCSCRRKCQCSNSKAMAGVCAGCPAASAGCASDSCTCQAPTKPAAPLLPTFYFYKQTWMYQFGCTPPATQCGAIEPIPTADDFQIAYSGESGWASIRELTAVFDTRRASLPDDLFLFFENNNTVDNCCADPSKMPPFAIKVTNNTRTSVTACSSKANYSCVTDEEKGAGSVQVAYSMGGGFDGSSGGSGVWIKNPIHGGGAGVFHVTFSVTDIYYSCSSCANSNSGHFSRGGFKIYYNEK